MVQQEEAVSIRSLLVRALGGSPPLDVVEGAIDLAVLDARFNDWVYSRKQAGAIRDEDELLELLDFYADATDELATGVSRFLESNDKPVLRTAVRSVAARLREAMGR
jgi:hypothetical protein